MRSFLRPGHDLKASDYSESDGHLAAHLKPMELHRQSLALKSLRECLIREIGRLLHKDAYYLAQRIAFISEPDQHPNWTAKIRNVNVRELSACRQALESMRALYDLD